MQLTHEGWSQERGWFCDKYDIDTDRTDHEIHWKNGKVCKQESSFENMEADFNNDGDVYTEFGCWFEGFYGGREWWTPYHLLDLILEGEATIEGITKVR